MRVFLLLIFLVTAPLVTTPAFAADPELSPSSIVSAAGHRGGAVSPGEIIVLHPLNAGPATLVAMAWDKSGHAFTSLAETRVLFDGQPAPLVYVVAGEIGAIVPFELADRSSTNVVVEYQGKPSAPVSVPVVAAKPAMFTQNRVGTGEAGILNETGCCNSEVNPAARGSWVTVYATGTGPYAQPLATGSIAAFQKPEDYPRPKLPVRLTVGGVPAELAFVAASPHTVAGLLQINFRVPANAPLGAAELVLSVGNAESTSLATMFVRSAKRRILLAGLAPATRKLWTTRLTRAGYEVVSAATLPEATALAARGPIDLAILESSAEWITNLESPGMKLLVLGTQADPESLRHADRLGAAAFVEKRAGSAAVLARVRELVKQRTNLYDAGPAWPFPTAAR